MSGFSQHPIVLAGVGGAGSRAVRAVNRAMGGGVDFVMFDTDASSGACGEEGRFVLLGGDRLSGRGAGGDIVSARMAVEDSVSAIEEVFAGARMAVLIVSLGGGTGSGATLEILRWLAKNGIPSIVFATMPFAFEGDARQQNARGITAMIEEAASATFFIPLDKLVSGIDNMKDALERAVGTLASAVSLFWRLVEKPGYIKIDAERLRQIVFSSGRGRFAVARVRGDDRASVAADTLLADPLLADGTFGVRSILCGVLAGDDLRLSEIGTVASRLRTAFGEKCAFDLGTVNDEETFSGSLSVVVMLFESPSGATRGEVSGASGGSSRRKRAKTHGTLQNGRFGNSEPTVWNGENLDIPTYVRKNINIDV